MPTILALRRLRQEGLKFKASLGYITRPCLKKEVHFMFSIFYYNKKVNNISYFEEH
jgi:hypothetical protein